MFKTHTFYPSSLSPWALEHRIFAISSRQRCLMLFRDLLEPLAQFGVTAPSASSISTGTTAALTFHILGSWQCIGSSVYSYILEWLLCLPVAGVFAPWYLVLGPIHSWGSLGSGYSSLRVAILGVSVISRCFVFYISSTQDLLYKRFWRRFQTCIWMEVLRLFFFYFTYVNLNNEIYFKQKTK